VLLHPVAQHRDQAFGLGAWFLNLLRHDSGTVPPGDAEQDMSEILLGVYFLSRLELKGQ
jgi:hypothetical protein